MGLIVLDASALIGFLDQSDAHHEAATQRLRAAVDSGDDLVLPASALAEVLVGPSRRGADAVATVRELLVRLPVSVAPLDDVTAMRAAELRAAHRSLKLPDALVIATAIAVDADELVTADRGWPSARTVGFSGSLHTL